MGLAPTGKRRLVTAHAESGRSAKDRSRENTGQWLNGKDAQKREFAIGGRNSGLDPERTYVLGAQRRFGGSKPPLETPATVTTFRVASPRRARAAAIPFSSLSFVCTEIAPFRQKFGRAGKKGGSAIIQDKRLRA